MNDAYYRNVYVRQRMIDYLGGTSLDTATCEFLTRCDDLSLKDVDLKKPQQLEFFLDHSLDVGRSLWDRASLIAHLDIEYVNFDFPAEPYLDLNRSFDLQEPTIACIEQIPNIFMIPLHEMNITQALEVMRDQDRVVELAGHASTKIPDQTKAMENLITAYERDYEWGEYWLTYDAGTRADFYARIFSGLFVTGRDDLVDYNCLSTKEKGICSFTEKPCRLQKFRESLLQRRNHERLASRPLNRLFLPDEHF